jgi:hypothetical protein
VRSMQALMAPVPPVAFASTATVGQFAKAVNSAEPSPDGRWLCVLCDAETGQKLQVIHPLLTMAATTPSIVAKLRFRTA